MKVPHPIALAMIAALLFVFSGCASDFHEPAATEGASENRTSQDNAVPGEMGKVEAELAKLPSADAASARAQKTCPVSAELLGTMGAPIKLDVNGETVWICCAGCEDALRNNPAEYLAREEDAK